MDFKVVQYCLPYLKHYEARRGSKGFVDPRSYWLPAGLEAFTNFADIKDSLPQTAQVLTLYQWNGTKFESN